eukprot:1321328-Rhodomonas_salina.4
MKRCDDGEESRPKFKLLLDWTGRVAGAERMPRAQGAQPRIPPHLITGRLKKHSRRSVKGS